MKVEQRFWQELGAFLIVGAAIGAVMLMTSCSNMAPVSAPAPSVAEISPVVDSADAGASGMRSKQARTQGAMPPHPERPGLGTGWGERVKSSLSRTTFARESNRPYGDISTIYYNDRSGIEAMAGRYKNKTSGMQRAANGSIEWGVKSGWGYADHYMAGGKRYVTGKKGSDYSLLVRNVSENRLEVVLSVDGLDVMDGKAASFQKRGYILAPNESVEVKGFRTSYDQVAQFEFASVASTYSNLRHGTTRDVGVIGLAAFAEKGRAPWSQPGGEFGQRRNAQPFAEAPLRTAR